MKIVTFGMAGKPYAVENFQLQHGRFDRADKDLIKFIESFKNNNHCLNGVPDPKDMKSLQYVDTIKPYDGITVDRYIGWAGTSIATVDVNEYDEKKLKVTIYEYDGSEALIPVPTYIKTNTPGLYIAKIK